MIYITNYDSPIGSLVIAARNDKLIGLWVEGQKYFFSNFKDEVKKTDNVSILVKTKKWLDRYFNGEVPDIHALDIEFIGSDFRKSVWKILSEIPYGKVVTYNDIACKVASLRNLKKMSAQAIGGAVGHNPISIIIPCHRVVGKDGNLTGYASGIEKKFYLLSLEGNDMSRFHIKK